MGFQIQGTPTKVEEVGLSVEAVTPPQVVPKETPTEEKKDGQSLPLPK